MSWIIAIPIAVFSYLYAARISAVGMGKDFAVNLGLNYNQVLVIGVCLVSVLSASVVMIAVRFSWPSDYFPL